MSNWTEEYLWDRQEAEQQSQKAMKNTILGKFITALYIYYNENSIIYNAETLCLTNLTDTA